MIKTNSQCVLDTFIFKPIIILYPLCYTRQITAKSVSNDGWVLGGAVDSVIVCIEIYGVRQS